MLFTYGDVASLKGKDWYPLELKSERLVEVYLRRIIRVIPGIFKEAPVELYIPLKDRDLDKFELFEGPFVYVRSDYFIGLVRLRKAWGVVGLATKGDSRILRDAIRVNDEYIVRLCALEHESQYKVTEGIALGLGVRVLDGVYRDFCGRVICYQDPRQVVVEIDLGFRRIQLTTGLYNLRKIEADGTDACWIPEPFGGKEESELITEPVE